VDDVHLDPVGERGCGGGRRRVQFDPDRGRVNRVVEGTEIRAESVGVRSVRRHDDPDTRRHEPSFSGGEQKPYGVGGAAGRGFTTLLYWHVETRRMTDFEEDDRVELSDEHSEFDGETGTVTQVMETMFGDATYTVSFEDGQEQGIPADQLELVESGDTDDE
jgi:hypothetical protein